MSEQTPQILAVDDDPEIQKLLAPHLETRDQLMDLTRGREGDVPDRSVDIVVGPLRPRRGTTATSRLFKTVRDGGYQLAVDAALQDLPS
jgi:two-component system, OmpR family, response regulator